MSIKFYNKNAKEFYENTVNANMKELYNSFMKLIQPSAHILDAGCGSGRDSLYFIQQGYKVTAMDGSSELAHLASELIKQPVQVVQFQEIEYNHEFDAVWACASLLHVKDTDIHDVLKRLIQSLNSGGILYASFKYGDRKEVRSGRYFRYHNEQSFTYLLSKHSQLQIINMQKTADVRKDREEEYWLNVFMKKIG